MERVAHQVALNRVLQHLSQAEQRPGIEPEFYRYQETVVKGELDHLQWEIDQPQDEYPNLQSFTTDQLSRNCWRSRQIRMQSSFERVVGVAE